MRILLKDSSDRIEFFIKTRIGFGLDNLGSDWIYQSNPMHTSRVNINM
jgi:hypothetical protein